MGEYADALRRGRDETGVREDWALREIAAPATPAPPHPDAVVLCDSTAGAWAGRAVLADEHGAAARHFHALAERIDQALRGRAQGSLLVCSARRREGRTTASCNLALALALARVEDTGRTALVDLDFARPGVGAVFEVEPRCGLERVLAGAAPVRDARLRTDLPGLDLFLPGPAAARAPRWRGVSVALPPVRSLLRALRRNYRRIVIDLPPLPLLRDARDLLEASEACLVVARPGLTRQRAYARLLAELPPERRLGAVANRVPEAKELGSLRGAPTPPVGASVGGGLGALGCAALAAGEPASTLAGAALGGLAGAALARARERRNPVLASPQQLAHAGLPLLGALPEIT